MSSSSSPIMRAGQRGLTTHKISSPLSASAKSSSSRSQRVADIGRRNFTRNDDDYDDEDEDDAENDDDPGEGYSIDPSVQLWKSIDFTKNLKSNSSDNFSSSSATAVVSDPQAAPMSKSSSISTMNINTATSSSSKYSELPDVNASPVVLCASVSLDSLTKPQATGATMSKSAAFARVEELKRQLQALETEKSKLAEEGAAELKNLMSSGKSAEMLELLQQKLELKQMKDSMQFERKELELRALLAEAEAQWQKEESDRRLEKEREEMSVQLEVMRMQNQMLKNRMEQSQALADEQLSRERSEKQVVMSRMEQENQRLARQILETQAKAEADLAKERDDMRRAMKRMESEKNLLLQRVQATEEQAKNEAVLLEMQKAAFQENLLRLESEKQALAAQMLETKASSSEASVAMQAVMAQQMRAMEEEKAVLAKTLLETEERAMLHARELAKQLEKDKEELNASLERMAAEKQALASHLSLAEREAQERSRQLDAQLAKEKQDVIQALGRVEEEKRLLQSQIASMAQSATVDSNNDSNKSSEQSALEARLAEMANEKEQLKEAMQLMEATALQREQMVTERIAKERDELKQAVQRMREEFAAEQLANNSSHSGNISTIKTLKPSKSLFDLMGESKEVSQQSQPDTSSATNTVGSPASPLGRSLLAKKSMVPRTINVIPEEESDLVDSFMDDDSSTEGDKDRSKDKDSDDPFADLPAPHSAAASGNLVKLKALAALDPSLLMSYDAAHRNPLFYAAAFGRADIVSFLLSLPQGTNNNSSESGSDGSQVVKLEADVHGDTAIHAATSAGNPECLELLLQRTSSLDNEVVSAKNKMEMTPAHLAASSECLEVLYKYGAELDVLDCNGRSPLFVACAMNRDRCAEYLINALDQDETSLMIKDGRGDTPLHAAACNGSVECLLLLLQYGIDPTLANERGLKAIELAVKNKHKKCKELLMEYHLHFSTSGEFDSVLFLAALEGHRQIKRQTKNMKQGDNNGGGGDDIYQIIRKKSVTVGDDSANAPGASPTDLKRIQSFFSLKANKSLRLQRWGPWIAYEDQTTQSVYWYNHETSAGQWQKPDQVVRMQLATGKVGGGSSFGDMLSGSLSKKTSMRMKRMGEWIQYVTEGGQTFYYNEKNADFQWHPPTVHVPLNQQLPQTQLPTVVASISGVRTLQQNNAITAAANAAANTANSNTSNSNNANYNASAVPDFSSSGHSLTHTDSAKSEKPEGFGDWRPYKDPTSGEIFWYNEVTKVSQWDMPAEIEKYAKDYGFTVGSQHTGTDIDGEHDHEVVNVFDENDLGI